MLYEIDAELEDRMRRRRGLVFVGVEEPSDDDFASRKKHDKDQLDKLLGVMKIQDDSSSFVIRRISKPIPNRTRLLHVECKDDSTHSRILANRTLLKNIDGRVYIQPDLTKMQQEASSAYGWN